jgi:mannose-6-phosphate isomerase-like protein (cupin superfamily)
MPTVAVVDAGEVPPRLNPDTGLIVRPTLGTQTGFDALEQAVLECAPGHTRTISVGTAEETLFVLGGRGSVHVAGQVHDLEPEVGLYLPPGSEFELHNPGPEPLRVVAVRVPHPDPQSEHGPAAQPAVCRLGDQELQDATTQREFRIVAGPDTGLRSATHFVGYIPAERAPDHFHTYDEVIYVLEGEGFLEIGGEQAPLRAGSCVHLPARIVHCLANTGTAEMRVLGVFRPAGSPAEAYYPDGTLAMPPERS